MRRRRSLMKALWIGPIALVVVAVFCLVVMALWNWLVPDVFGGRTITFWQAVGLMVLSRFLLGRFHGRPAWSSHWRHRLFERWERMTPEERERLREHLRRRCHPFEPSAEPPTV